MEFSIITFLLVAVAMAFADVCWTLYFIKIEERHAHAASFWSAMIILVSAFTVTNYVENKIYIVAAFIGAYLGTYGTIVWKRKNELGENMTMCVKCEERAVIETNAQIPLKKDKNFMMDFKMSECNNCGWIFATEPQRQHNEETYNRFFKLQELYRNIRGH